MRRTRIKICGFTRRRDIEAAVARGVDAIGLVFTRASRRFVTPEQAAGLCHALPPFVCRVGLFMDDDPAWVEQVLSTVGLDLLQFHGREGNADCRVFGRPFIKAIAMGNGPMSRSDNGDDFGYPDASGLLFDAHAAGQPGGTGHRFDWHSLPAGVSSALILAGGLDPDNVSQAIRQIRPYAVDVSSGVESAPGIKDQDKMSRFIHAVRVADEHSE